MAAGVLLAATPAAAAFTQYDCTFPPGGARHGNWVPAQLVLRHDGRTGQIVVFDPIIRHFHGAPLPARAAEATAARVSYLWTVELRGLPGRAGSATMDYRLSYFRNGRPARMTAVPRGFDSSFTGEGACRVTTG
jgi:hypothetical protein